MQIYRVLFFNIFLLRFKGLIFFSKNDRSIREYVNIYPTFYTEQNLIYTNWRIHCVRVAIVCDVNDSG